ncbi:hypothetical protein OQY15_16190 [Pedobacter sp. MC2016-15]|uniref:DUF6934 family protein n=1 Tax=Pedobacter sp. MC2016-15 TaxID=2994473 RepID=UPI002246A378|nr:hypothetical protein [Pedobacter sp. MC2016-15]MCX2480646.1 hypothetical protein [Pedobacter sp. MC2016-15]
MSINSYLNLETSSDFRVFDFESVGKTTLKKRALFDLIDEEEQLYNLALCTVAPDGTEDFDTESKNGDMDMVLETVAHIAKIYSDEFPTRKIYFRGSTVARSRKYQMGINKHLDVLTKMFDLEGLIIDDNEDLTLREAFQAGTNYNALIFT